MGKGWKAGEVKLEEGLPADRAREEEWGGTILGSTEGHTKCKLITGLSILALKTGFQIPEENGREGPAERQGAVYG